MNPLVEHRSVIALARMSAARGVQTQQESAIVALADECERLTAQLRAAQTIAQGMAEFAILVSKGTEEHEP